MPGVQWAAISISGKIRTTRKGVCLGTIHLGSYEVPGNRGGDWPRTEKMDKTSDTKIDWIIRDLVELSAEILRSRQKLKLCWFQLFSNSGGRFHARIFDPSISWFFSHVFECQFRETFLSLKIFPDSRGIYPGQCPSMLFPK